MKLPGGWENAETMKASGAMSAADVERKNPKFKRRLGYVFWAMIVLLVSGFIGLISLGYFIPDHAVSAFGFAAGAGLALVPAVLVAIFILRIPDNRRGHPPTLKLMVVAFLVAVVVPASLILTFGSVGFIYGLPNLYTMAVGRPAVRQVIVIKWSPGTVGRFRACAGVDFRESSSSLEHVCLFRQVAPGTVLTLHGRQSVLGFHISAVD